MDSVSVKFEAQARQRLLALLTEAQRTKLQALLGEPIPALLNMRGGGGFGGGGGGPGGFNSGLASLPGFTPPFAARP
jgi:hypothetical protein